MSGQLRFTSALCHKKTKGYHFTLDKSKSFSSIIVPKAVFRKPSINMSVFPGFFHMIPEDFCLCLNTFFKPVINCSSRLTVKRKFYTAPFKDFIGNVQKRQHSSIAQIIGRLIHDFLCLNRCNSAVKRLWQHFFICFRTSTADKCR